MKAELDIKPFLKAINEFRTAEPQPCGVQVVERVGLGSHGVDELLDTLRGCDDLRNRFPVLVSPGGDSAPGIRIDAGELSGHVVNLAIGMPECSREGKGHAGLERRSRGARDRGDKTASITQLSHARPLPCFRVVAPDR